MYRKVPFLIAIILSVMLFFFGCADSGQTNESTANGTSGESTTVEEKADEAEQLLSLSADEIKEIIIERLLPKDNGKTVYKTLTADSDKTAVLEVNKNAEINTKPLDVPSSAGRTLYVKIYLKNDGNPIIISQYDESTLSIGSDEYSANGEKWQADITEIYDKSDEEEKEYRF